MTLWDTIANEAERESALWGTARRSGADEREPVFSPLAAHRFALAVETIYEGYLVHYGKPRLFAPEDPDVALLLGDYLYAHGLVRLAQLADADAVTTFAELIAHCAELRAEGEPGDGEAWADAMARLGGGGGDRARALAAHAWRVG